MSASRGQRKAALYLASLSARDRRQLMATLPAAAARPLSTLVDQLAARGWVDGEVMSELLAEELRGLTSDTALTVEDLLAISHELPSDLTARLFAANSAMDRRFMLALLEGPKARRKWHLPRSACSWTACATPFANSRKAARSHSSSSSTP